MSPTNGTSTLALGAVHSFESTAPGLVLPPIEPSQAATVFGLCLSFMSYGIMLCQCYQYYRTYWRPDSMVLKLMVTGIFAGETVHTALYYYLVTSYGHPENLGKFLVSLILIVPVVTLCILCCQFVYIRRAYMILPERYRLLFCVVVVLFTLDGLAFSGAFTAKMQVFIQNTFGDFLGYRWLLSATFAPLAALDIFVASMLSVALHKQRSGMKRSDALVHILILYAFSTGIFTSALSLGCLLTDLLEGRSANIVPFALVTAKVYANSVLLTLNLRQSFHQMLGSNEGTDWISVPNRIAPSPHTPKHREGTPSQSQSSTDIVFKVPTTIHHDGSIGLGSVV
ncbi:hypothetical protein C8Q80DRAFT_1270942 [Daedaleopsis nitida]|nr:hypothetical protein C8Q80DRAFT_1270942 [Daedaleopsis nitida]